VPDSLIASYTIRLPSIALDSSAALVFSMAESGESASPKSEGKWVRNNPEKDEEDAGTEDEEANKEEEENAGEQKAKKPIDFTIQLVDSTGQKVSFPLSRFAPLQREIEVVIKKTAFIKDEKQSEKVFQTFYFPADDFRKINPDFNTSGLHEVKLIFDKSESGVIVIDNIGFMKRL